LLELLLVSCHRAFSRILADQKGILPARPITVNPVEAGCRTSREKKKKREEMEKNGPQVFPDTFRQNSSHKELRFPFFSSLFSPNGPTQQPAHAGAAPKLDELLFAWPVCWSVQFGGVLPGWPPDRDDDCSLRNNVPPRKVRGFLLLLVLLRLCPTPIRTIAILLALVQIVLEEHPSQCYSNYILPDDLLDFQPFPGIAELDICDRAVLALPEGFDHGAVMPTMREMGQVADGVSHEVFDTNARQTRLHLANQVRLARARQADDDG
jgi:hypothetical protein